MTLINEEWRVEKSKKSINVEDGVLFCGGWDFSKSVNVGSTFIREMRVYVFNRFFCLEDTKYRSYSKIFVKNQKMKTYRMIQRNCTQRQTPRKSEGMPGL